MSTINVNRVVDASGGVLAPISSVMRNRIINGAMVIDQRNAGASVTPTNSYTLDRWQGVVSQVSKFTVQQNAGSVTPPDGYKYYLGVTSSSAYSVLTGDFFMISQRIEGYNFSDLMFGTASAKTFTFSFWVRSSLTGTFGGSFQGAALATLRSYPFSYTISSANTWEQKSITVAGDTFTNTWDSTNGIGLFVNFGLGAGATASGTAGVWASANYANATGATSVVGTNGATFYITGVQLEVGTQATSFEYRQFTTELQLCQRYYQKLGPNVGSTSSASYAAFAAGYATGAVAASCALKYNTTMRTNPTISQSNTGINVPTQITATGIGFTSIGTDGAFVNVSVAGGLTTYQGLLWVQDNNVNGYVDLSAEL
jgi:hypothetical protein